MLAFLVFTIGSAAAGQRYAIPAANLVPVEMHASCTVEASADVNQGAAWLHVLAPREARQAFDRAADADPDCALAYWGRAASYLPLDEEMPAASAVAAGAAALLRARAVPLREPHERALVDALAPVFMPATWPAGGVPAFPARLREYRDRVCAMRSTAAKAALAVFCARAAWLGSTLPGDSASVEATRIVAETFDETSLTAGAAVVLLQAEAGPPALIRSAAHAVLRLGPPAPAPFHLACRAFVRAGDWARAAAAGEAALARARSPVAAGLILGRRETTVTEWLVDTYGQQGRASDIRRLLSSVESALAAQAASEEDVPVETLDAHRVSLARIRARWILLTREDAPADPVPDAVRATAPAWLPAFASGLRAAIGAWPAGRPELLAEAKQSIRLLASAHEQTDNPEIELGRVLIDAAIAASQDEHHTLELLVAHAADLESRIARTRRGAWPIVRVRELAAELWLRAYRDADAIREARAVLAEFPNRVRPWVVLARAAARLKRGPEAALAYETVLAIRKPSDDGDAQADEARRYLAARPDEVRDE